MPAYFLRVYLPIIFTYLIIIIIVLVSYSVYRHTLIMSNKTSITNSYEEFKTLHNRSRYFSKNDFNIWILKWYKNQSIINSYIVYDEFINRVINKSEKLKPLLLYYKKYFLVDDDYNKIIKSFSDIFKTGFKILKERNDRFIYQELIDFKEFFDSVAKESLTLQQRMSIIVDEAYNLIVTGAGTGKTNTIIGKTEYLIKKQIAKPEEILILTYNQKSKNNLEKITQTHLSTNIEFQTFHALGLNIIEKATGEKPTISDSSNDPRKLYNTLNEFIKNRLANEHFLDSINKYFTYYIDPTGNIFDFESEEEHKEHLRQCKIITLQGEHVKNYEQCILANFLYQNGIKYEYEKEYIIYATNSQQKQYRPDFYLPEYGIWIENFDIEQSELTTPENIDQKSLEDIYWKRNLHLKNSTYLIETYTYENTEGNLIQNLRDKLNVVGVKFNPIPNEEIYLKIKSLGEIGLFTSLIAKFLNLFKSQNTTIQKLRTEAKKHPSWRRYNTIIDIFEPLYEDYEQYLQKTKTIDNNDIINQATEHITNRTHMPEFKYILVDEFQETSKSQYNLLKSILEKNKNCQLFCVGDDWQSIHRSTGSDMSIMTNFGDHFNPNEIMFLDETFRLNDSITDFSSNFIMKNPEQYKKKLKAKQVDYKAVTIVWYENINQAIKETINRIKKIEGTANVLIISRYELVFYPNLKKTTITTTLIDEKESKLSISHVSAQESKGKEADYVILLGLKSGAYGFPCEIEDDPVLNLVLTQENMYPNSEERRVFYVGITRAKKRTYLLADRNNQSAFIKEIQRDNYDIAEVDVPP